MGTGYKIFNHEAFNKEISLYEMSNKFDFYLENDETDMILQDLSTNQLLNIALKIIQVCSYFMDTDRLKKEINQFINKNIY